MCWIGVIDVIDAIDESIEERSVKKVVVVRDQQKRNVNVGYVKTDFLKIMMTLIIVLRGCCVGNPQCC